MSDKQMARDLAYLYQRALLAEARDPQLRPLKEAAAEADRRAKASSNEREDGLMDSELRLAADAAYHRLLEHISARRI